MSATKPIALVTGGGTGIGLACARLLHQSGWRVICAGLEHVDPWPAELEFIRFDVCDEPGVRTILSRFEKLDGLVNAAGIILHEHQELTPEGFNRVIAVNLNAVNLVTLAALPALTAARGAIVNISSMWSYFGSALNPAYSASKAGISALTRSHAVAFAPSGLRVNAVAPGWIDTRLAANAIHNSERSSQIFARIPMGRWGTPEDVAKVVRFLLGDDASYVTGSIFPVDGGYSVA